MAEQSLGQSGIGQADSQLRQLGRRRVAAVAVESLRKHAPFNRMTRDALEYLAERAQVQF